MSETPTSNASLPDLAVDRRPFLKLLGGGAAAGFLGNSLVERASAESGTYDGIQVDLVTGTTVNDDLGSTTYSSEGRLVNWEWGERYGNTGEDMDKEPKSDTCDITTDNGVEFDFANGTASVSYSLNNCGGQAQELALVAYDSPISDQSNPGWDPANASDQTVYDAVVTATTTSGGTLTVDIPVVDVPAATTNHWRVNAGSGTTLTDAKGSLDATISSLGSWSWQTGSGLDDTYLQGSSESAGEWSMSGSASAFSHFPNGQGTIACAVYADAGTLGNRHAIFGSAYSANNSVFLGTWDSSALTFRIESGGSTVVNMDFGGSTFTEGAWHTVAVRCDGSTAYAYVDGQQVNTATLSNTATNSLDNQASIGKSVDVNSAWTGRIDDVWVSDQAGSASDVTTWHGAVSDNYPVDPIGGVVARYDASTLGLSDGDSVSTWSPSTGSTDLTQGSSSNQPTFKTTQTPEGEAAVRFEGDSDSITAGSALSTGLGATISARFRIDDHTSQRQTIAYNGSDDNSDGFGIFVNKENENSGLVRALYGGVSWFPSGTTITDNDWHTATLVVPNDGSKPSLYLDGTQLSLSKSGTANAPSGQFGIGEDGNTFGNPPELDGDIDEVLVYDRPLTVEEIRGVEAALGRTGDPRGAEMEAYYSLDGSTATNGVTGANATESGSPSSGATGEVGSAFQFTASTGDGLTSGNDLPLNGDGATVAAWVNYTSDTDDTGRVFQVGGNAGGGVPQPGFDIEIDSSDNAALVEFDGNGGVTVGPSVTLSSGTWYYLVAVVKPDVARLHAFTTGGEVSGSPATAAVDRTQSASEPLHLAAGDASYLDGKIDEVKAFSRALPETEVTDLYLQTGGPYQQAYYSLDGSTATNSVTGVDATVSGSPSSGATGQVNSAFDFTASNGDGLTSGNELPLNGEGATVAAWVNYTSSDTDTNGRVFQVGGSTGSTPGPGFDIEISDSDVANLVAFDSGGAFDVGPSLSLSSGTWYYLVAVVDGDQARLHAFDTNGELGGSPATATAVRDQSATESLHLAIGDNSNLDGKIDEVKAYAGALSKSAVVNLYNQTGGS